MQELACASCIDRMCALNRFNLISCAASPQKNWTDEFLLFLKEMLMVTNTHSWMVPVCSAPTKDFRWTLDRSVDHLFPLCSKRDDTRQNDSLAANR